DSPASKPTKPARKPKSTTPKAPPRPARETSDNTPKAKKSKYGVIGKKRSLKSVVASEAEDVPVMEPQVAAEDTDFQKALEESMKIAYPLPRGLLLPVVIREPESKKYQPLPEVPGKGKAKVTEEQVAHDLLSLQKPKKKSPADQYIFQMCVSEPTGSSGHDESPYVVLRQSDSKEESEKVVLGADEGGQGEGQAGPDPGAQAEGQAGSDAGDQDECQAGSNPDEISEGQAGPDPGNAGADVHSIPSRVVYARSDCEHMDLDVADVSPQPTTEQLYEGFTAMTYLKAMQAPLQNRFRDLPEADMKEILHQRMWETESYKTHEDYMQLFEALEESMNRDHSEELAQDLAEARKKKKKSRELPKTPPGSPPPPPPPAGPSGALGAPGTFGSSQLPPPPPPPSSTNQEKERPATPEPAWSIPSSDAPVPPNNWASALASNYSPPPEDSLLTQTGDIATFIDRFCKKRVEECHKLLTDGVDDPILRRNVSKPLPLGGPPGQLTIQSDFFFNEDLEYLRYASKGSRHALSISKMKASYYPDAGLDVVRTHMRILSVVRIEVFSMYGYDYMNKIVYRCADLNEHVIAERDFKHRVEDFQLGIESYQTQLNLTKPQWDAKGLEYKHDYTVIDSPKAVMFREKYGVRMMMRFNEIHKFSDGTLHPIITSPHHHLTNVTGRHQSLGVFVWRLPDRIRGVWFCGLRNRATAGSVWLIETGVFGFAVHSNANGVFGSGVYKIKGAFGLAVKTARLKDLQHNFRDSDVCCYVQENCGYGVLMSQPHKWQCSTSRMVKRCTVDDDLNESSKITQVKGT
nr:hypothetical protein [Tanacetum cinerariifolium]